MGMGLEQVGKMAQLPRNKSSLRAIEVSAAKWAAIAALITAGSGALKMVYDAFLPQREPTKEVSAPKTDNKIAEPQAGGLQSTGIPPVLPPDFAPPQITNVPSPFKQAVLQSNGKPVRLRTSPSLKATTIRFVEPGETVSVSERIGNWWYVQLETGERGYVNAAFLSKPR